MAESDFIEKCCRICATNCADAHSIYKEHQNGKRTVEMLEYCLQQPIDKSEQFPEDICDKCSSNLIATYEFFLLYKKSEEYFLALHQDDDAQIKIENVDVPMHSDALEVLIEESSELPTQHSTAMLTSRLNERPFECSICKKTYAIEVSMIRHKKQHTSRIHDCEYCNESFETKAELINHVENLHKNELRSFGCNRCSKVFFLESMLTSHSLTHNSTKVIETKIDRKFQCQFCPKALSSKHFLRDHIRAHTGEKPFKCRICGQGFASKKYREQHSFTHFEIMSFPTFEKTGTITYECFYCKTSFEQLKTLYQHIRQHPNQYPVEKPFECSICKLSFSQEKYMLIHKRKHTKLIYDCKHCDASFQRKTDWKNHLMAVHGIALKPYKCEQCSDSFSLKSLLTEHSKIHGPKVANLCAICGKVSKSVSALNKHLRTHDADKPFACTQCPSRFKAKSDLKSHIDIHIGERNHVCAICEKAFVTQSGLRSHKLAHSEDRRFQCETCSKRFHTKFRLDRHILTHTGEKPYKCEYCDRAFTQSGDMKKHLRIHIGTHQYKCNECDESFRLEIELRKHSYRHYKPSES